MVDDKIAALAKEFHELGGCTIVKRMSDFKVHEWFLDLKNNDPFPGEWYDNYKDRGDCIPILDESELWAWLESQINSNIKNGRDILDIDIRRLSVDSKLHVCVNTIGNSPYSVKTEHFDLSNGLHTALYAACVWILRQVEEVDDKKL